MTDDTVYDPDATPDDDDGGPEPEITLNPVDSEAEDENGDEHEMVGLPAGSLEADPDDTDGADDTPDGPDPQLEGGDPA